eukprot:9842726-Lingulodinium_polyedra.AAC.1
MPAGLCTPSPGRRRPPPGRRLVREQEEGAAPSPPPLPLPGPRRRLRSAPGRLPGHGLPGQ